MQRHGRRRRGRRRSAARRSLGDDHRAADGGSAIAASRSARAAASTSERRIGSPSSEPRSASAARSGWGMSPATLPRAFRTPAIARRRAVRVRRVALVARRRAVVADVPEQDLAVALELVERRVVGEVAALAVGDRHPQRPRRRRRAP